MVEGRGALSRDLIGRPDSIPPGCFKPTGRVQVIWGASGNGKTSAASAAAAAVGANAANAVVVVRFCGTSPGSSSALELLRSICWQIARAYPDAREIVEAATADGEAVDAADASAGSGGAAPAGHSHHHHAVAAALADASFHTMAALLVKLLALATAAQPLTVCIDSLDQLSDEHGGRSRPWAWLPKKLPDHVSFVVTTLPDERYGILDILRKAGGLKPEDFVEVPAIGPADAMPLLTEWLSKAGRRVSVAQASALTAATNEAAAAGQSSMLYIKLLFDMARQWTSGLVPPPLPRSVPGLIEQLFAKLEKEHGAALTARILGLLAASKSGLSQNNLLDLVSGSDDVLGFNGQKGPCVLQYHTPPIRRLPPLVFLRMLDQMRDFMAERGSGGVSAYNFYHRQFLEIATKRYLATRRSREFLYALLSDYFGGQLAKRYPARAIEPHVGAHEPGSAEAAAAAGAPKRSLQALSELPWALVRAGPVRQPDLLSTLADLDFFGAKVAAGLTDELATELADAWGVVRVSSGEAETPKSPGHGGMIPSGHGHSASASAEAPAERRLAQYRRFFMRSAHHFRTRPALVLQVALNEPPGLAPAQDAARLLATRGRMGRPWLKLINPPAEEDPCRLVLEGHADEVLGVAFAPDGATVASCSRDGSVRVMDTNTGTTLRVMEGHTDAVRALAFGGNGVLVSAGEDLTARVWQPETGTCRFILRGHTGRLTGCAVSAAGDVAITFAVDKSVRVFDLSNGSSRMTLEGHTEAITSGRISPAGPVALTTSQDKTARLWNIAAGAADPALHVLKNHTAWVTCSAFDPTGAVAATGSVDKSCRLWSVASGAQLAICEGHAGEVTSVAFASSGDKIATASRDKTCRLWKAASGEALVVLRGHSEALVKVLFAPGDQLLLTAARDATARLWDAKSGQMVRVYEGHNGWLSSLDVAPDGRTAATGGADSTCRLWAATRTTAAVAEGHVGEIVSVQYGADGRSILTCSRDRTARLWEVNTSTVVPSRAFVGHLDELTGGIFSPDQHAVLTCSLDKTARIWNAGTGEQRALLQHAGRVTAGAFNPNGLEVLTASDDKVYVFQVSTGKMMRTLEGHIGRVLSLAPLPDAVRVLSTSADKTAEVWAIASGRSMLTLKGHTDEVVACAVAPNGSRIATASNDASVRLWESATGGPFRTLPGGATEPVTRVGYSRDSKKILTSCEDARVRLYNADTGDLMRVLEGHTRGPAFAFSADGALAATATQAGDRSLRIWDLPSGTEMSFFVNPFGRGFSALAANAAASAAGRGGELECAVGDDRGRLLVLRLHEAAAHVVIERSATGAGLNSSFVAGLKKT